MSVNLNITAALALVCLASCSDAGTSRTENEACELERFGWLRGDISEIPNRAKSHSVDVDLAEIYLDGEPVYLDQLDSFLKKRKDLSPSIYIFLSASSEVSCNRYKFIASRINKKFNCHRNYCFYD